MPNHVTHKITFEASRADEIFAAVCPGGKFDFELLVPTPLHVYWSYLSADNKEDFPLNWRAWSRENWGVERNCYHQSCGIESGRAFIKFDTAWSIPYPIICAFANKFNIPFEHRYCDELLDYWGVETWGPDPHDPSGKYACRVTKRKDDPGDRRSLCIELLDYDPDADDDAEPVDNVAEG